jgi:hypothetical protein
VRAGRVRKPSLVARDVPAGLEAVCLKALALKPEERYASAADLAQDIARWLADEPPLAYKEPVGERLTRLARRYRSATAALGLALVGITLASVLALFFVNRARQAEAHSFALQNTLRDLGDGVQRMRWEPDHLARLDGILAELDRLAPAEVPAALAAVIRAGLTQPTQTEAAREWVAQKLDALAKRDPAHPELQELQGRYTARLRDWREVFVLKEPFGNLREVFDAGHAEIAGATLLPIHPAPMPDGPPLVRTRVSAVGAVQLEATFDLTWVRAPLVGLALQAGPSGGYQFVVSSFEYSAAAAQDLARHDPIETALKARERVFASISRDGVVLAQSQFLLGPGKLTLLAQRVGDRVRFQIGEQALVFDDLFAPVPPDNAPFAVIWPDGVRLIRLQGDKQRVPLAPSPMEEGDRLYGQQQFDDARKFYLDHAQQATDPAVAAQARFKVALCLYERGRKDEAISALEKLAKDNASAVALWRTQALARLWLWALRDRRDLDAQALYEQLPRDLSVEQLVTLIPAQERKEAIDALRLRGPRWRCIYETEAQAKQLARVLVIEERLNESPFERRQTLWRYIDLKRVLGDSVTARNILVEMLKDPTIPPDERVVYVRDLIWMMIEGGLLAEAHQEIDRQLAGNSAPDFLPLHLERARLFAAEKKWENAQKEVEAYLRKMPLGEGYYSDYADACLLLGFLRREQGDEAGAQVAWRRGLVRNWPASFPLPPRGRLPSAIVEERLACAGHYHTLLASLTGEWSDKEFDPIFLGMWTGTGLKNRTIDVVLRQNLPPGFLRATLLALCSDARGVEVARKVAYRQFGLKDLVLGNLKQAIYSAVRQGTVPGLLLPGQVGPQPVDPTREERTWQAVSRLFDAYQTSQLDADALSEAFQLWQGKEKDKPTEVWASLGARMSPEVRLSACYVFAQRFLFLGRPRDARPFLQELADSANPTFEMERTFAREQLRKPTP